ncbi:MAG TPA: aldo/keto reductase, partial [Pseudonocardia sp.]|nr:aldo/keto reductase [Pseudonocardia sp.]
MDEIDSVGFGGANLGNLFTAMTDEQAHAVLEAAWDSGIRYFDTAPHYGLGLAERRLGAFLAGKPRDEFVVSTKVGRLLRSSPETSDESDEEGGFVVPADRRRVWDASPDGVRRSLEESLE